MIVYLGILMALTGGWGLAEMSDAKSEDAERKSKTILTCAGALLLAIVIMYVSGY